MTSPRPQVSNATAGRLFQLVERIAVVTYPTPEPTKAVMALGAGTMWGRLLRAWTEGRALYAAVRTLPVPTEPLARLWQGANLRCNTTEARMPSPHRDGCAPTTMRLVRPVVVHVDVPQQREEVYDVLDVLAVHEEFTDHMLRQWHCSGPARGVGAAARVTAVIAGRSDSIDIEVIAAQRPFQIIERNTGAAGRRVAQGTYLLKELPGGGTRIFFKYAWQSAPWSERLTAPLIRSLLRRANQHALQRLAGLLDHNA